MRYVPRAPDAVWGTTLNEIRADLELGMADAPITPAVQLRLFPPRFGYMSYQQRQLGIADIIDVPRIFASPQETLSGNTRVYPPQYTTWAQSQGNYSGTSRPSLGDGY